MTGKLTLFEYVVLQHPTKEEAEKGVKTKIIIEPSRELAQDEKSVGMKIARKLPDEVMDSIQNIEIIIRPF